MPSTPTHPSLHYEVHGTTGTGVLLIMGLGMRGRIWQPQLNPPQLNSHLAVAAELASSSTAEFASGSSSRNRIWQLQPNSHLATAESASSNSRIRIC